MAEKQAGEMAWGALDARPRNSDITSQATGRVKDFKTGCWPAEGWEAASGVSVADRRKEGH